MCIENMVWNKAPNNNDATHVANNVYLNTMAHNNSQLRLYSRHHAEKLTYQR